MVTVCSRKNIDLHTFVRKVEGMMSDRALLDHVLLPKPRSTLGLLFASLYLCGTILLFKNRTNASHLEFETCVCMIRMTTA